MTMTRSLSIIFLGALLGWIAGLLISTLYRQHLAIEKLEQRVTILESYPD